MKKNIYLQRINDLIKNESVFKPTPDSFKGKTIIGYNSLRFVALLCILGSTISEGAYLFSNGYMMTNNLAFSFCVAAFVIVFIEAIRVYVTPEFVRIFLRKYIKKEGSHWSGYALILFIILLVGYSGSFYFSFLGMPTTIENVSRLTKNENANKVNVDSINQVYDLKIAPYQENIKSAKTMTWSGKIVSDGRDIMKGNQLTINKIESQRESALALADSYNHKLDVRFEDTIEENKNFYLGFAGFIEFLSIVVYIGIEYLKKYYEVEEHGEDTNTPKVIKKTAIVAPRKIGEGMTIAASNKTNKQPVLKHETKSITDSNLLKNNNLTSNKQVLKQTKQTNKTGNETRVVSHTGKSISLNTAKSMMKTYKGRNKPELVEYYKRIIAKN